MKKPDRAEAPQAPRIKKSRVFRLVTGWVLTIAGLVLGPVPLFPGFVLLIPGVAILCAESRWVRSLLRRFRERRLMRKALREAERVGLRINLDHDPEVDGEETPPDPGKGRSGG